MPEERGVTKKASKVCPCEACKKARGVAHKIVPKEVHSYSSQPIDGWRPMMTRAERATVREGGVKPYFLGVELETDEPTRSNAERDREIARIRPPEPREPYGLSWDSPEQIAYREAYDAWRRKRDAIFDKWDRIGRLTSEEIVSMARPRGFWHAKHDSSVSGPEFASLPASLDWWYSRRAQFDFMFTTMLHAGVRSHVGDNCGLHVNVALTAFADAAHLARFAKLVNLNASFTKAMSQRTEHSLTWGMVGERQFSTGERIENWAVDVMRYGAGDGPRYSAINTPGQGRIEFRVPRGTLRIDRFYKNIEWVHSMIEFTRQFGSTKASEYMRWVMAGDNYADLQAFLKWRFHLVKGTDPLLSPPRDNFVGADIQANQAVLCEYNESLRSLVLQPRSYRSNSDSYEPDYEPEPDYDDNDEDDRERCPCGDGCYMNDCGNCENIAYVWSNTRGEWMTSDEWAEEEVIQRSNEQERAIRRAEADQARRDREMEAMSVEAPSLTFDQFIAVEEATQRATLAGCDCYSCTTIRNTDSAAQAAGSELA